MKISKHHNTKQDKTFFQQFKGLDLKLKENQYRAAGLRPAKGNGKVEHGQWPGDLVTHISCSSLTKVKRSDLYVYSRSRAKIYGCRYQTSLMDNKTTMGLLSREAQMQKHNCQLPKARCIFKIVLWSPLKSVFWVLRNRSFFNIDFFSETCRFQRKKNHFVWASRPRKNHAHERDRVFCRNRLNIVC